MIRGNWKNFATRFQWILLLVIATMPFHIALNGLFCFLLILHSFSLSFRHWNIPWKRRRLVWGYMSLFILYFVSLAYTDNRSDGLELLSHKLNLLLMPPTLVLGASRISTDERYFLLRFFVKVMLLAAVVCIALGIYRYLDTGSWYRYWGNGDIRDHHLFYTGLASPLMHPGYLSVYVGTAFLLLLHEVVSYQKYRRIPALLFLGVFLLMLQGRMNILSMAAVLLVYGLHEIVRRHRWRWLFLGVLGCVLAGTVFWYGAPQKIRARFTETNTLDYDLQAKDFSSFNGLTIRLAEWECAWLAIARKPWLGYGIGDADHALQEAYTEKGFVLGVKNRFNSHNQYIETWLATGIPGVAALLALLISAIVNAWRGKHRLLGLAVVYFALCMVTESMLERSWGIAFFSVMIFWIGTTWPHDATVDRSPEEHL